jgi:hypothetical protein
VSKGRSARRKGHQFERETAVALRGIFPGARRQLEYHADDALGVDVQGTGRYKFQCKKYKNYAPISCLSEVQCAEALGEIPILVTAGDNLRAVAVLPFADLLDLISRAES